MHPLSTSDPSAKPTSTDALASFPPKDDDTKVFHHVKRTLGRMRDMALTLLSSLQNMSSVSIDLNADGGNIEPQQPGIMIATQSIGI